MLTRNKDYWENLSKIPFKNEVFSRKEELGVELSVFISQKIIHRHRVMIFIRSIAAVFVVSFLSGVAYVSSKVTVKTDLYAKTWLLPCGSDVKLGANSEITYNRFQWLYSRRVTLIGSGHFSVTKGSEFKVQTGLADIQVLGTVFDVNEAANGESLSVLCEEGSVKVSTSDSDTVLKPGESVEVTRDSVSFIPRPELFYTYNGVSLAEVSRDLERYFNCKVIDEANVREILFSGIIPTADLNEALILLSKSCNVNFRIDNNTVYLYK